MQDLTGIGHWLPTRFPALVTHLNGLYVVIVVQVLLSVWIIRSTAPGWDEWGHLPSGLYHLQFGRFEPYCVNPPLVRVLAAIPVWLAGGDTEFHTFVIAPSSRPEWQLAIDFQRSHGRDCFFYFTVARLAVLPFSLLGTFLIYQTGNSLYGRIPALLASCLWVASPTVLANGTMVTPDVPATVMGLWSVIALRQWLLSKEWGDAIVCGFVMGITLLCKATWIILFAVYPACWFTHRAIMRDSSSIGRGVFHLISVVAISLLVLNVFYAFDGSGSGLDSYSFVSKAMTSDVPVRSPQTTATAPDNLPGNRFHGTWIGTIPVPLPKAFIEGIDLQKSEFEKGKPCYLFGEWKETGRWYYYAIVLFLKEPIALWIMLSATACCFLFRRSLSWERLIIFVPGVIVFLLASSQVGINRHVRYVLPVLPVLYLAAVSWIGVDRRRQSIALLLVVAYAVSSFSCLPRSYSFFSEVIGGPHNGWCYLGASNLDWGQDLITLANYSEAHPEIKPLLTLYSVSIVDLGSLDIRTYNGDEFLVKDDGGLFRPAKSGWWAVFAQRKIQPNCAWFRSRKPEIRLSPTIDLHWVSPEEVLGAVE